MISIIEAIRFVIRNMLEKKKRIFLTIFGILIGIFTFTFFLFVSQGLKNTISDQFTSFGTNVLGVREAGAAGDPSQFSGLTDREVAKIESVVKDYKYVAPGIFANLQYEYGRVKAQTITLAYPKDKWDLVQEDFNFDLDEGRQLKSTDVGVVVLGYKFAHEAFGDKELGIGNSIKIEDRSFRVIGILAERGDLFVDNAVLMSFEDIKQVSGRSTYSIIRVSFLETANIQANREAIDRKMNPGAEKKYDIESPEGAIETFNSILGLLTAIITFVSSIALIVGGINVMNTMYSSVLERMNEISVMKALGARNEDIRNLFLIESGILGALGSIIGFFLAFGFAKLLSYLITFTGYNVPIYFDTMFLVLVVGITIFFSMLFGTYPALKAAKINPADNLRDDS
jgi:putative ABC transport system permease protein